MTEPVAAWVVDDRESVAAEAAPYRQQSPSQRLRALAAACRAAARLLRIRDDRETVLSHVDPLPQSTVEALRRLRRSAGSSGEEPALGATDDG